MADPETLKRLEQLLTRLEPETNIGVTSDAIAASVAVSLRRIADAFEHERTAGLPLKRR